MKKTKSTIQSAVALLAGGLFLAPAFTSQATVRYWDTDGTNPGLGVGGPYDWIQDDLWNTDPTGGAAGVLGAWTNGDSAVFNGVGVSTITVASTDTPYCTNSGFTMASGLAAGSAMTVNLTGPGTVTTTGYTYIGDYCGAGGCSATLNLSSTLMTPTTSAFPTYVGNTGCSGTANLLTTNAYLGCYGLNVGVNGGAGTINITNGTLYSFGNVVLGKNGNSTLSIYGGTNLINNTTMCGAANVISTVNLNGGVFTVGTLEKTGSEVGDPSSIATVNFNGGIWRATRSSDPSLEYLDYAYVQAGGAIFDNTASGLEISLREPLTGGVTNGAADGGLTKIGAGSLLLWFPCTYTGGTTISNGNLYLENYAAISLDASIFDSAFVYILPGATLNVNNLSDATFHLQSAQILEGGGQLTGNLDGQGIISPGYGTNLGTLTVAGVATLNNSTVVKLNRALSPNSDKLTSTHTLTQGGTLTVNNVGAPLVAGDTFTVIGATGGMSGSFSTVNLPSGYVWNTSSLASSGKISVTSVITVPQPALSIVASGAGSFTFSATNGTPNEPFILLTSTNVATPVGQWMTATNGSFDANGNLSGLTVTGAAAATGSYYILEQQ